VVVLALMALTGFHGKHILEILFVTFASRYGTIVSTSLSTFGKNCDFFMMFPLKWSQQQISASSLKQIFSKELRWWPKNHKNHFN